MQNITNFDFKKELSKYDKIFCLVSGGIDSTYLLEMCLQECDPMKVIAVNCYNPYEQSETLTQISKMKNYISVKPLIDIDYKQILYESFMKLPQAVELKKQHKYMKKVFPCCNLIKHKAFLENPLFCEENSVVISGIKYSDGRQRNLWLKSLRTGITTTKGTIIKDAPTFFHIHKGGQNYCYPFRDFKEKIFPLDVMNELKVKYPTLDHSGCKICPVLVLFANRIAKQNEPRFLPSIRYAESLGLSKFIPKYEIKNKLEE